jgi:hypothetical protein
MSGIGTFETCRLALAMSVDGGGPEVAGRPSTDAIDPMPTLPCRTAPALFDGQTWLLPLRVVRHWLCYNSKETSNKIPEESGNNRQLGGDNGTLGPGCQGG